MSDRGSFRGRGRGGYDRGGRGASTRGGAGGGAQTEKPKKENILDLSKYLDKTMNVKFNGGREGALCRVVSYSPANSCSLRNPERLRSTHEPGPG